MEKSLSRRAPRLLDRILVGSLLLVVLLLLGMQVARAGTLF